jgi:hypothetical protein
MTKKLQMIARRSNSPPAVPPHRLVLLPDLNENADGNMQVSNAEFEKRRMIEPVY